MNGTRFLRDEVMAGALIDRLLHHSYVINITGNSYRMREHADVLRTPRSDGGDGNG